MSIEAVDPIGITTPQEPRLYSMAPQDSLTRLAEGMRLVAQGQGGAVEAVSDIPAQRSEEEQIIAVAERVVARAVAMEEQSQLEATALVDKIRGEMLLASARFKTAVALYPPREPEHGEARQTKVSIRPADVEPLTESGWHPAHTFIYESDDPFHRLNPELVDATSDLIQTAMGVAEELRPTRDPELTYISVARSRGGKKNTVLTESIMSIDPGIADWTAHLPDAERLRPVAKPWSDEPTIILEGQEFKEIPQTPAQQVLMGGSGDGRGVREREGWEVDSIAAFIEDADFEGSELTITSLGTGTGEPAMDSALHAMERKYGEGAFTVKVNGIDVNPASLAVASHIASQKKTTGTLEFLPAQANLLSKEGIAQAVGGTNANVYEAIGFAEYVPSDYATSEMEQEQREKMRRIGCLSAEEFYGAIYDSMPSGSVLLTGNMRDDSPQASFVIDGLGWKGIIQRSTKDYLTILERAGIPAEAVSLYMPDQEKSAGVYNLVAIKKL